MDEKRTRHASVPRVLLAGGGSGGHVFPALAVGDVLAQRGWSVHWAGRPQSMEESLVKAAGVPFHPVAARAVVGRGRLSRVGALAATVWSALGCRRLVRRLAPRAVVGTGGFVAVPTVLGARWAGRPALLLEPNARAGLANRFLSRWAQGAAIAHSEAAADLACSSRVTGVPVRHAFFEVEGAAHAPPLRVLVLGGSQGARQLNELVPAAFAAASLVDAVEVRHQAGEGAVEAARRAWAAHAAPGVTVEVLPFIDDVAEALAWAHLVVSRAGAITVAEICASGRASILVPLAAAGAHQVDNARAVEAAGAADLLESETATPERLAALLSAAAADPERLSERGRAARSLARPQAATEIADLVEALEVAA